MVYLDQLGRQLAWYTLTPVIVYSTLYNVQSVHYALVWESKSVNSVNSLANVRFNYDRGYIKLFIKLNFAEQKSDLITDLFN